MDVISIFSLLISLLALILSSISFYKSTPPFDVQKPVLSISSGELGYFDINNGFVPLLLDDNYLHISYRIVNPKSINVSIFNIQVIDENNEYYNFIRKIHFPEFENLPTLYLRKDENSQILKMNIPYNHYNTYTSTSYSHLDLIISTNELKSKTPKILKIYFRDTRSTFLIKTSRKIISAVKMKNPIHYYEYDISTFSF